MVVRRTTRTRRGHWPPGTAERLVLTHDYFGVGLSMDELREAWADPAIREQAYAYHDDRLSRGSTIPARPWAETAFGSPDDD